MATLTMVPGTKSAIPTRTLGKTGRPVTIFGLGGEGVLRSTGRMNEAVAVIRRALEEGVTYFDTAPAYQESRDYLGAALGNDRKSIFLASKTHVRDAEGTKRLLDESLTKLKTDHLDSLQLHDLRSVEELDKIFGKGGAMEAMLAAKSQGVVRFFGITGHHDPRILREALRRYPFDTILTVVNPGEPHGPSFAHDVLPEARRQGVGVVGMKTLGAGGIFKYPGLDLAANALRYAWSRDIDVAIVGCKTPEEVSANAAAARSFAPLPSAEMADLERRNAATALELNNWKHPS